MVKLELSKAPGYIGTRENAERWMDEAATIISELQAERDALLQAAGYKPGILDRARDVILSDIAGMRPAMVDARRRLQDFQSDALSWQMFCAEEEFEKGETLFLKIWRRCRAAESSLFRTQAALLFWMPGVDSRLDEATRERAAQDATLLAGYTGPVDGPCWGNETLDSLSRIKSETVELRAVEKAARKYFNGYVQDEAAERECCISDDQHADAKALQDALAGVRP